MLPACGHCDRRRRTSAHDNLVQDVFQCEAAGAGWARSDGLKVWREMIEQKVFRGMERYVRRMWERFTLKKTWARSVLADVDKEWQHGTEGGRQQETPYKEEPELVMHSSDLRFEGVQMRRAYFARKSGRTLERGQV